MSRSSYEHVAAALLESVATEGDWVAESPQRLRGPGTFGLILDNTHSDPWHVDVGIQLNRERPDAPIMWDCMAVAPQDLVATAQGAVARWRATTFAVMQELVHQSGEFATHIDGDDPDGLPGWHTVQSPLVWWGAHSGEPIVDWLLGYPLLPALAPTCLPQLIDPLFNTLKVSLGGGVSSELAEVRVNGTFIDAASDALLDLPWPRIETTWVRAYALVIHQVDQA